MPNALDRRSLVRTFVDDSRECASYLVASCRAGGAAPGGEAAVIDPGPDLALIETALAARRLRLRYVIDTRVHTDHVSGARALTAAYAARDGTTLCLHALAPSTYPFRMLRDGDVLALGHLRLRVAHLPTARPEQIGLVLHDPRRGPTAEVTLGGALGGNRLARVDGAERAIEATNLGHEDLAWAAIGDAPDVPQLTLAALEAAFDAAAADAAGALARPLLLDVREPSEFARGHVPGALNVPLGELTASVVMLPRDRPLVTVCDGGARAVQAAQRLRAHGFARVSVLGVGTTAWRLSGRPLARRA